MKILDPGHKYALENIDGDLEQTITFVKRDRGEENHPGTMNQELLRVLINRVRFLNYELPCKESEEILHHLRMALVLHECRALRRKVEKGKLMPENVSVDKKDGHYRFDGGAQFS